MLLRSWKCPKRQTRRQPSDRETNKEHQCEDMINLAKLEEPKSGRPDRGQGGKTETLLKEETREKGRGGKELYTGESQKNVRFLKKGEKNLLGLK